MVDPDHIPHKRHNRTEWGISGNSRRAPVKTDIWCVWLDMLKVCANPGDSGAETDNDADCVAVDRETVDRSIWD